MPKQRISSRLANKQKKELTKQSIVLFILAILIAIIFFVVVLPSAVRLFFEVLDKQTVIEQDSGLPPQRPIVAAVPEFTNQAELEISGYSQPNSTVKVLLNHQEYTQEEIDEDSTFSISIKLNQGANQIAVFAIDTNEQESQQQNFQVILDTEPPPIKIGFPEDGQRFELKENQTVVIEGESEPKARVFINGRVTIADSEGFFSQRYYLSEGENLLEFKAVDEAGNESETTITVHYRD